MSTQDFCFWLQGWFEIQKPQSITATQLQEIKNHLDLVFNKVTPNVVDFSGLEQLLDCSSNRKCNDILSPSLNNTYCGHTSLIPSSLDHIDITC